MTSTIINCEQCNQKLRAPTNRGALSITCPSCSSNWMWMPREDAKNKVILDKIKYELLRVRSYRPKVGVFGDSGVGKSSLCNALFGKDVASISDVEACTRKPQDIFIGGTGNDGITLVDVPGVGEDIERHKEYVNLYKSLSPELDLVLWVIKADDRKYMSAIEVYLEVLKPNIKSCPVVFVITQVDKIEPYRDWDCVKNKPGSKQNDNITIKINDISSRFNVSKNNIIAVSSTDSYNLVELVNLVVEVLPNDKKYPFTREIKDENVSEEAMESAEKGVFDHIKELAGDAWGYIKDEVEDILIESAKKVAKKALKWIKTWLLKI